MIKRVLIQNYKGLKDYEVEFDSRFNVIVGPNGSGKSTLLEEIGLALGGRLYGRWPSELLTPYWFNREAVEDFFDSFEAGKNPEVPSIAIEVTLANSHKDPDLGRLEGKMNKANRFETGMAFEVALDQEYVSEFWEYMRSWKGLSAREKLLPTEYFTVHWHSFASPDRLSRKPKNLDFSQIDAKTYSTNRGIDRYTQQLLSDHIPKDVAANLSVSLRSNFEKSTREALQNINEQLLEETENSPTSMGIQIDPAISGQWQSGITPGLGNLPFNYAGEGEQAIAKVEVALLRSAGHARTILFEEPENHLSHTRLRQLLERVEILGVDQQLIVTTHSSFVLNRLGLDNIILMGPGAPRKFVDLETADIEFFQKLPNFDTLRLVLATHVVLVEGISDLLVVENAIKRCYKVNASSLGIDIISVEGVKHQRWFRLAQLLQKRVIGIRDNDGQPDGYWEKQYKASLGYSELFVGEESKGKTLEPQIEYANPNNMPSLKSKLAIPDGTSFADWAVAKKSDAALELTQLPDEDWVIPRYIERAVAAIIPELQ